MPSTDRRTAARALLAVVLVAAVGLTACGRKGPLEAPPSAAAAAAANPADPDAPKDPGIQPPDKRFVLDPLL